MMKRMLSLLAAAMVAVAGLCVSAADQPVAVSENEVTVSGKVSEKMAVSIMVYEKDTEWIPESCLYANTAMSGEDGSYVFTFTLPPAARSGDYTVFVGDAAGGVTTYEFSYIGLIDSFLAQVADTDALTLGALEQELIEIAPVIGLSLTDYNALSDQKKSDVLQAIAGKTFADEQAFCSAFEAAVTEQKNTQSEEQHGTSPSYGGGGSGNTYRPNGTITVPATNPAEQEMGTQDAFSDLDSVPWAVDYIRALYDRGIVSGNGEGQFEPDRSVTRAEFMKMLVLAMDLHDPNATCDFSDVPEGDWAYSYIASGVTYGLADGYPDGRFGLHDSIRREDMAVMAYNALKTIRVSMDAVEAPVFSDIDEVSGYAKPAVETLSGLGVINGSDGLFRPGATATRAETAKIVGSLVDIKNGGDAA